MNDSAPRYLVNECVPDPAAAFDRSVHKPLAYLPAHRIVEQDVGPIRTFIPNTHRIVMKRHGIAVLGRDASGRYHRVNVCASELKRRIIVGMPCAANGTERELITAEEMKSLFSRGDGAVHPQRVRRDTEESR